MTKVSSISLKLYPLYYYALCIRMIAYVIFILFTYNDSYITDLMSN